MTDPPPITPPTQPTPMQRRGRGRWRVGVVVGVVAIGAAGFGYLFGSPAHEPEAPDPLGVVRDLAVAEVSCTQVIRVDDRGGERAAVCLTTGNEVLTIGTFSASADPEAWIDELCDGGLDGVVPLGGTLVVTEHTLVTVVGGPLSSEGGGRIPDPDAVARRVAVALGGSEQRYECTQERREVGTVVNPE